ncbi:hypothetical protein GWK91_15470 [Virgibacillus sp. MSP4-1]|uniref:HAAS domain-containing protein n=1 Tax=Virgibacillus sp. MSP4-1 TaxID=2700081 RepID=UPI0003A031BB|nr:hypothetical protein [Virgibacillus sp. MSP4-1]QHS24210.1 hypothetical protein GWK91_15470 [Virgibacillus sp. MSP4-1]
MELSKRSQDFLDNLRLYLFSSGRNEHEIAEIISELDDHLREAEKDGKDVEHLIGQSPKEYMEQIAGEMPVDYKGWLKYIPILLLGVYAYLLLGNAVRGGVEYSLLKVIGDFTILIIVIVLFTGSFKYLASHKLSGTKEKILYFLLGCIPIGLFIGLNFLDKSVNTPVIVFNQLGNIMTISLCIVIFAGISIWSKTWVSIIVPALLYLPEVLLKLTPLNTELQLILSTVIMLGGLFLYFYLVNKFEKI